jgi:hypothetical protein
MKKLELTEIASGIHYWPNRAPRLVNEGGQEPRPCYADLMRMPFPP